MRIGVIRFMLALMFVNSVICISDINDVSANAENHIYATWDGFEADKCASIWLIMRFVDPDAKIKFYPKGTPITSGIAFDTPDAALRRYHNMAAFESIARHYGLLFKQD